MTDTSLNNWVMAQLEPDGVMIVGRPGAHITTKWVEKNNCIAKLQEEMGLEEYRRRSQEDANKAREWYEHENNL